jgi:hypothetical protein
MKFVLKDNLKLSEIQAMFHQQFTSLKLEFFEFKTGSERIFSKKNMISDTNRTIGSVRKKANSVPISFNGNQKVSTLESSFLKNHGLNIQIFRRSGKNWIETSSSDELTLASLNKRGIEALHSGSSETAPDFDQYHEQP